MDHDPDERCPSWPSCPCGAKGALTKALESRWADTIVVGVELDGSLSHISTIFDRDRELALLRHVLGNIAERPDGPPTETESDLQPSASEDGTRH